MSTELLINVTPYETRIARVENGRVEELYIERERERDLKGNIYKGKVQRVLPGIQAAFVDIGMRRAGFLHVNDVLSNSAIVNDMITSDNKAAAIPQATESGDASDGRGGPKIAELLRDGQEIVVQVSKDPISSKGPRLTGMVSLAGRYLVYLPNADFIGIARRIESQEERKRLIEVVEGIKPEQGGLIVRTAAEGKHLFDLQADLQFLLRLWRDIDQRMRHAAPGSLIHLELNLYLRVLRDFVDDEVEKIYVDSRDAYSNMKKFAKRFMPEVEKRLFYYPGERPIFELYGVEDEIRRALKRRVPLKSGGYLVIDQTEALIAIDVNSGSFVSSSNLEETSFKTNLEAVHEIVHQLRLRNLGGIIVVDFIDMQDAANRKRLMEVLSEALTRDQCKTHVVQLSELGLVEMTRKRTRESLGRTLLTECSCCNGVGRRSSLTTICYDLFRSLVAESRTFPSEGLTIVANPEIIELLLGEESDSVVKLEIFLGKSICLQSDARLSVESYEIVLN